LGIVPLTIAVGSGCGLDLRKLVIFEGIAANSGSLLTPFGNPQNIFIAVHYDVPLWEFCRVMAPLWLVSLGFLMAAVLLSFGDRPLNPRHDRSPDGRTAALAMSALVVIVLYFARVLPTVIVAPAALVLLLFTRKMMQILRIVDWKLYMLFVFMAFATFALLEVITLELSGMPLLWGSIGLSQLVSNVPATFVLSGASNWKVLAIGVDIGGSGTLISSVATVIAYRFIKRHDPNTSVWDFMKWGALFCVLQTLAMLPLFYLGWY
jgi:Na+/H+ antiporter NhaD/arsenite permease-like protein